MPLAAENPCLALGYRRSSPQTTRHLGNAGLDTALGILLQKGPSAFTLSDVAEAVGISRAALIQRFKDKATLHRKVMERTTQEVRDYFAGASPEKGLDPLWAMLKDLIAGMGAGVGTEGYLLLLWGDIQEPSLRTLAAERNRLVLKAIEARLPAGPRPPRAYRRPDSDGHSGVLHAVAC